MSAGVKEGQIKMCFSNAKLFRSGVALWLALFWASEIFAQSRLQSVAQAPPSNLSLSEAGQENTTSLSALIEEVKRSNPQILAASDAWRAATRVPSQVSTLPDPQLTVQDFAVGNPLPWAGYTTSNFAYVGFGVSQDIPYPGKLRLRGEAARQNANAERNRLETTRRSIIEQLKTAYFQLAYEHQELALLDRDAKLLDQIANIAEAHYRVGQGNQQDVLKAQLEKTRILAETETHRQQYATLQAKLKQLLNRSSEQPGIVPDALTETPLHIKLEDLLGKVRSQNPEVREQQQMTQAKSVQVELARKDFYPDFSIQYMWQHTAPQYRDYYMLTFGVTLPIFRGRKQWPELAQATEELTRSRHAYEAQVQQTYFDVRDHYLQADTAGRVLNIYRQGLIPQAASAYKAGLAAYESNREDFETLLASFLDVLHLDEEYWRNLLTHEVAVARLEQVTGLDLGITH